VEENYAQAMENAPEMVVGQVFMLYVPIVVNGVPLKAFVDSGAQMTIMSSACARRCGVMRLADTRFAGVARGVGEQKIIGRVHALSIQIGAAHLPTSISILEKDDEPSFIFGLDMLKRHQCCIDLGQNCLTVGTTGERVTFLSEADLPKGEGPFGGDVAVPDGGAAGGSGGVEAAAPGAGVSAEQAVPGAAGAAPAGAAVAKLVELGFTAAAAAEALAACDGNAEQAAALLFSGGF
jgi:DNA damage-inducible protein 1